MSVGGFILLTFFTVFAAAIILWPVVARRNARTGAFVREFGNMSALTQLRAEREAILQLVRDLDFDYQTGKLLADDYISQRESLMARGVEVLRQIESHQTDAIEAAVSAARQKR